MASNSFTTFIHKKVLVKGEAGSGKTLFMQNLLREAVESLPRGSITLIDLAPERKIVGEKKIGGPIGLGELEGKMNYMRPAKLHAPRLEGKTREKVVQLARENAEKIDAMLDRFLDAPTNVLFVNDLTMYLHSGSLKKMLKVVDRANTFIGNAYEGILLAEDKGSGISETELRLLKKLEGSMDIVITL